MKPHNKLKLLILLLIINLFPLLSMAHPTAFQGSYMFSSGNSQKKSEQLAIYNYRYYLGLGLFSSRYYKDYIHGSQISFLAKRWNLPSAQANIYFYGGYGYLKPETLSSDSAWRFGTQWDYETREVYTAYKYKHYDTFNDYQIKEHSLAVGFAPFVAEFDELNIWLISDWRYMEQNKVSSTDLYMFLRFFYKNVFWEAGSSIKGDLFLNFMVHYYP